VREKMRVFLLTLISFTLTDSKKNQLDYP